MRSLAVALLVVATAVAQQPNPPYAAPVLRVQELAQALADAINGRDEAGAAKAKAAFEAGVDTMLAGELLAMRDYNKAATMAMNVRCPEACQRIARHAIAKLEQPGQLREFLGIANMELAQRADTDAEMRALASEAAAALAIWCEAKPGSAGPGYLVHALGTIGAWEQALAWDDRLRERRSRLAAGPLARGIFLLGAGQWDAAIAQLRADEVTTGNDAAPAGMLDVLVSRAEALRGKLDAAIACARANVAREPSDAAVAALADVLAFAGKHDEAVALLKKHPAKATTEDPRGQAGLRKSRAVFEYLVGLRGKRPADLRQQLARLLEAKFVVMGAKEGDALGKQLASSPWALAYTVQSTPSGSASWANDLLFAVCVRDVATYQQPEAERAILGAIVDDALRGALTGPDAEAVARRHARSHFVLDDVPAALVVRKLLLAL
jgi:hypothetical protein